MNFKVLFVCAIVLFVALLLPLGSTLSASAQQEDEKRCEDGRVYLKKNSTGDKVCVSWNSYEELIERGYGILYYDRTYIKVEGTVKPTGPPPYPFERLSTFTFYTSNDINVVSVPFLERCTEMEFGTHYGCTVYWKNGTKSRITPDFDIESIFNELDYHSPLAQLKDGKWTVQIICKEDNVLLKRNHKPYCVSAGAAEELEHRGWSVVGPIRIPFEYFTPLLADRPYTELELIDLLIGYGADGTDASQYVEDLLNEYPEFRTQ